MLFFFFFFAGNSCLQLLEAGQQHWRANNKKKKPSGATCKHIGGGFLFDQFYELRLIFGIWFFFWKEDRPEHVPADLLARVWDRRVAPPLEPLSLPALCKRFTLFNIIKGRILFLFNLWIPVLGGLRKNRILNTLQPTYCAWTKAVSVNASRGKQQ